MSAREFSIGLDRWADAQADRADQIVRAVGLEALSGAVLASPVDTGRFRGNWQVNQDGSAPELDVEDKSGGATISRESGNVAQQDRKNVFYIANGLPYAKKLEDGHSQQAPAGVLGPVVNRLRTFLQGPVL